MQGYITNADYSGKKTVLVLFINGRPVDCSPLKKAIENTYSSMLPKAAKPWIYLVNPNIDAIINCFGQEQVLGLHLPLLEDDTG